MQHADLDRLVDLAERRVHRCLNGSLGTITWFLAVGVTGTETPLHQGPE